jgi:hypothetical protein
MNRISMYSFMLGCLFVSSCYTPGRIISRPSTVVVANNEAAQTCLRQVDEIHETCEVKCPHFYNAWHAREQAAEAQQCVTDCDDSRDARLRTCPK